MCIYLEMSNRSLSCESLTHRQRHPKKYRHLVPPIHALYKYVAYIPICMFSRRLWIIPTYSPMSNTHIYIVSKCMYFNTDDLSKSDLEQLQWLETISSTHRPPRTASSTCVYSSKFTSTTNLPQSILVHEYDVLRFTMITHDAATDFSALSYIYSLKY